MRWWAGSLWKGRRTAEAKKGHSDSGRAPLTKSSTNFLKSSAVLGSSTASLINSYVHPSLWEADILGIPMKASVMALMGT